VEAHAQADAAAYDRFTPRDSVDQLLAEWAAVRPELDFSAAQVVARLGRIRARLDAEHERLLAAHDLTRPGFAALLALARLGDSAGVSQRRLAAELGLTPGTVSVRVDRLAEAGWIERLPDPEDRRNALVSLTAAGRAMVERVTPAHLESEDRLLAGLNRPERDLLAALLRKLLVEFEGSPAPADAPARLGLTVAPAHVTIAMRRAVALPAVAGLLVRAAEADGPAAAAGLRPGDVLTRAGGRALRSVAALRAAVFAAGEPGRLRVRLLRGTEELTVAIGLAGAPTGPPPSAPDPAGLHRL
jgi:DNA-binding MarR family transcriptional regulator